MGKQDTYHHHLAYLPPMLILISLPLLPIGNGSKLGNDSIGKLGNNGR